MMNMSLRRGAAIAMLAIAVVFPTCVVAQQPVSPAMFDKFVRYTYFAAAAYSANCISPPFHTTIVRKFEEPSTDTRATLFRDDQNKELIVAFRGTTSLQNAGTDLNIPLVGVTLPGVNCSACQVHSGFQAAYMSVNDEVVSAIRSEMSSHRGWRLIVVGHSLGGALAALAVPSLTGQGLGCAEAYTYGEPRNGDSQWAQYMAQQAFNPNYHRVTHSNDGVPQIPPTIAGYVHHGTEYWQSDDQNSAQTTMNCGPDSNTCNTAQFYGLFPINEAHGTYSNMLMSNVSSYQCEMPKSH